MAAGEKARIGLVRGGKGLPRQEQFVPGFGIRSPVPWDNDTSKRTQDASRDQDGTYRDTAERQHDIREQKGKGHNVRIHKQLIPNGLGTAGWLSAIMIMAMVMVCATQQAKGEPETGINRERQRNAP